MSMVLSYVLNVGLSGGGRRVAGRGMSLAGRDYYCMLYLMEVGGSEGDGSLNMVDLGTIY